MSSPPPAPALHPRSVGGLLLAFFTALLLLSTTCGLPQASARSTASPAAGPRTVHKFASAGRVEVSFRYRSVRRARAPQRLTTLARFSRNHIAIQQTRRGRIVVRRGRVRWGIGRARRRGAWTRLTVTLRAGNRILSGRVGKSRRSVHLPVANEQAVVVGAPPTAGYEFGAVQIRSTRAPSSPQGDDARPFARDSFWNARLAHDAPLDGMSNAYADELRRQVGHFGPYINTYQYSTPVYTVPADQPTVRVTLDEVAAWVPRLQEAWERVPIPAGALPAEGTDSAMIVWQPSTDTMWEFWLMKDQADGWHARWGGRMNNVSTNPGYYNDPPDWGSSATSLPALGGLMRVKELDAGRIDHALAIAIPETRQGEFSWPAQRTDGNVTGPNTIPEGTRFRIDPDLDLSKLTMSKGVRAMAVAAQRYGMVVRDRAGAVVFFGEPPQQPGDPYYGTSGFFQGEYIGKQLAEQFPWKAVQTLKTQIRSPR